MSSRKLLVVLHYRFITAYTVLRVCGRSFVGAGEGEELLYLRLRCSHGQETIGGLPSSVPVLSSEKPLKTLNFGCSLWPKEWDGITLCGSAPFEVPIVVNAH